MDLAIYIFFAFFYKIVIITVQDLFYNIKQKKHSEIYSRCVLICNRNPCINKLKNFACQISKNNPVKWKLAHSFHIIFHLS